ncbi:hypothetical protein CLOBOL_07280 [Enterocloster bolteae ATCC BAA-613]|uniref:Uncharacterized protein n=1 Tax=Enterocloster bolteae (strain ATCC BAA-613 / DSM 15670 / CCUG 46953 / JCM 12243 / WAL 16351) TaxID=411902 RepID=A8S5Q2_ENTBW|nr:hypothetical protein CLOBOL_07280 [Enterocloster bolteae ATCC BAA-613]
MGFKENGGKWHKKVGMKVACYKSIGFVRGKPEFKRRKR